MYDSLARKDNIPLPDGRFRLRVTSGTSEFEIEGSEDFVEKYWDELRPLIARDLGPASREETARPFGARVPESSEQGLLPENFADYLNSFREMTGVDQILVAGFFQQSHSSDNIFTTGEANKLLQEQGLRVSNASDCVKRNVTKKLVFKTSRGFRVSRQGERHITELIEAARE